MRPPEFTGGNRCGIVTHLLDLRFASMRPPEFTGGNLHGAHVPDRVVTASMRPPEFTGGNRQSVPTDHGRRQQRASMRAAGIHRRKLAVKYMEQTTRTNASMRPPEFTGGNLRADARPGGRGLRASMRPPEFTGGNRQHPCHIRLPPSGFNEAAGIHRRKRRQGETHWNR